MHAPSKIMTHTLTAHGYGILKDGNADLISALRKQLTVAPRVNPNAMGAAADSEALAFPVFGENSTRIYVPRAFGLAHFGPPATVRLPTGAKAPGLVFEGELREAQRAPVAAALAAMAPDRFEHGEPRGGLLVLPCGFGKTSVSLYIAAHLGGKTIVVCHKEFLIDQWIERIAQFLPRARVGRIQQAKVDVAGKDIVLASLQSISMRNYDADIFSEFHTAIFDECLPGYQHVWTPAGPVPIHTIYDQWAAGETPHVIAYDEANASFAIRRVTYAWRRPPRDLRIVHPLGLHCTSNHLVRTMHGWCAAGDLRAGDLVLSQKATLVEVTEVASIQVNTHEVYDLEVDELHTFVACTPAGDAGVVVHNCHHLGAQVFSRALAKIPAPVQLGLSATPTRKDGLTKVFEWHIGKPLYVMRKRQDAQLQVRIVPFDGEGVAGYGREVALWNGKLNYARMINDLCGCEPRNQCIVDLILDLHAREPNRRTIVLSERRSHLCVLDAILRKRGWNDVAFCWGGMSQETMKENESRAVLLATTQLISEAYDNPNLNSMVIASPLTSLEQPLGRIQRQKPEDRTCVPLVIDVQDDYSVFANQGRRRRAFYKKNGYTLVGMGEARRRSDSEKYAFVQDE